MGSRNVRAAGGVARDRRDPAAGFDGVDLVFVIRGARQRRPSEAAAPRLWRNRERIEKSSTMRLVELLEECHLIVERWIDRAAGRHAPGALPRPLLADHMPAFPHELAGALRAGEGGPPDQLRFSSPGMISPSLLVPCNRCPAASSSTRAR
jgi:hypothetical protein